jgi:hypothetical protein
MRRSFLPVVTGVTAAAIIGLSGTAPAHADPAHGKHALGLQIGCDDDHAYAAVMNGKGTFSAIHDLSSTSVLVPVAVGQELVTVLDPDLNVRDQWKTPAHIKKALLRHHTKSLVTCDVFGFDPQPNGDTITVQGSIIAHVRLS